ncbi:hypothetical protein N9B43_04355 [Mariniblastus sp.]|nr:hypothetical protein [Mariniblastus sp.]
MKQELPLAVALLAAGSLLWLTQLAGPAKSSGVVLDSNESHIEFVGQGQAELQRLPRLTDPEIALPIRVYREREVLTERLGKGSRVNSQVAQVTYEEEIPQAVRQEETSSPVRKGSVTGRELAKVSQSARRFLLDVSNSLAHSMPFEVDVSMTGWIFDQEVAANGKYYQMGQGTQKSSLVLEFANKSNPVLIHQLCDGKIVFKLQKFSDSGLVDRKDSLEFVNLDELRASMADTTSAMVPTGWVASGGIACTMRHLSAAFDFEEKKQQANGDVVLRGVLNAETITQLTGKALTTEEPAWASLPSHFPHSVEITFGVNSTLSYVPRRMSFSRFSNLGSKSAKKELKLINIDFSRFQELTNLSDSSFRANYIDVEKVDVTEDYIARIKKFGFSSESQSAEKSNETFER